VPHNADLAMNFERACHQAAEAIWSVDGTNVFVDEVTIRARPPLPQCSRCGRLARPNVLMFGDWSWIPHRSEVQQRRYRNWLEQVSGKRLAVIECGAGTGVPTVRWECEGQAGQLIRVNPRDTAAPPGSIVLPVGALQAIRAVDKIIGSLD
jgi:hypothetical protein